MASTNPRHPPASTDANRPSFRDAGIRWNAAEEYQLTELHITRGMSFVEIAPVMKRSSKALAARWATIQLRDAMEDIDWTPAMDTAIITGRSKKVSYIKIALQLKLDKYAVQARWKHLKDTNQVPDDMVDAPHRARKPKLTFSQAEDEAIMEGGEGEEDEEGEEGEGDDEEEEEEEEGEDDDEDDEDY